MRPIAVVEKVSIYFPQGQVLSHRAKFLQARTFLRGGGCSPSGADKSLLWCAWGVSSNPPLPAVPGALPPLGRPVRLSLCIDVPNPPGRPSFGWPAPPLPPAECVLLLTTYWPIRVRFLIAAATGSTPLPLPPTAVPFPFPVRYRHALSALSPFRAHCFLPPVFSPAPSAHRIACGTVPL